VLRAHNITRYHLIGHSMGGLTALLLADRDPSRVASFVNIEGNLEPEDCFLSRQIISHSHDDPDQFLALFAERVGNSRYYASSLYASALPHKIRAGAVKPIFESMVALSDGGDLRQRFVAMHTPKLFMYGCQNNSLSYLEHLRLDGVEVVKIPHSGHFPMYSNPPAMWAHISRFVASSERARW
jgi:pimeloyl-ACP methyl ester carboxylesterase